MCIYTAQKIKKLGKIFLVENNLSVDFLSWCEAQTLAPIQGTKDTYCNLLSCLPSAEFLSIPLLIYSFLPMGRQQEKGRLTK